MPPWEQYQSAKKPWEQFQEPRFIDRVGADIRERSTQGREAINAYNAGEQSAPETALQVFGKSGAGTVLDVGGEVAKSLYDAGVGPKTKQAISSVGNAVMDTRFGRGLENIGKMAGEQYGQFAQNNPRASRNIESTANIVGIAPIARMAPEISLPKRAPKVPILSSDFIKQNAGEAYRYADEVGGVLPGQFTDDFLASAMKSERIGPQSKVGKMWKGKDGLPTQVLEKFAAIRNKPVNLQAFQEIDEELGDLVDAHVDRLTGSVDKEGQKILAIQDEWRDALDNVKPENVAGGTRGFEALNQGRGLWSASRKMRDIEKIITRAELTQNPATSMKTGFRNLYLNDKRMKGFSKEEKKLIMKAALSGKPEEILATLGSRLVPIGTVIAGGGVGGATAAQVGSMAARGAREKMQALRAQKIQREISKGVKPFKRPEN